MLSKTALGAPRFSMTRERPSSSSRRKSLPKLVRARSAETTILSFLSVGKLFISIIRTVQLNPQLRQAPTDTSLERDRQPMSWQLLQLRWRDRIAQDLKNGP